MLYEGAKEMMNNKQPTQEQIKEFWEWCGFSSFLSQEQRYVSYPSRSLHSRYRTRDVLEYVPVIKWNYADGRILSSLPELNLDNLFRYAVPKLFKDGQGGIEFRYYPGILRCILATESEPGFDETQTENKEFDPALALFWAIWGVIKE